jgi:hypothetical protein
MLQTMLDGYASELRRSDVDPDIIEREVTQIARSASRVAIDLRRHIKPRFPDFSLHVVCAED